MGVRWKFRRLGQEELERVAVGDLRSHLGPRGANGYRKCGFEWANEVSRTMTLP
jgi:hypothetical protein